MTVDIGGDLYGDGVIGAVSGSGTAEIKSITNSLFLNSSIVAQKSIMGAAGVSASIIAPAAGTVAGLGNFTSSRFENLSATSNTGDVYAGAVYSSGLANELVIIDSSFMNNTANSAETAHAGAIGIDTAYANPAGPHQLTLTAANGQPCRRKL